MDSENIKKIALFLFLFALSSGFLKAQEDVSYNHIFSVATYYNPSFAGTNGKPSFSLNIIDGDLDTSSGIYSFCLSYDQFVKPLRGGIGFIGYYNLAVPYSGDVKYFGCIYAPKYLIFDKVNISPSLKAGYMSNNSRVISENNDTVVENKNSPDFSAAIMVNSKSIYAGFAVDHFLQPEIDYFDNSITRLKRKYVAQLGYHCSKNEYGRSFIHLNILYQNQERNNLLFISNYYAGKMKKYRIGSQEVTYRMMYGLGFKTTVNPSPGQSVFIGVGTQDKTLTVGIGLELSASTFLPKMLETSIKFVIDRD